MKPFLRVMSLVWTLISIKAYAQYVPKYIVCPGEYQCFIIKSSTNTLYAVGTSPAQMGIGSNPGPLGLPIPVAFPAGVQIKDASSPLHNGMAVDMNGNVWFWGINDGGQRGDGTVEGAISYSPVMLTTDSLGNPFTNVVQISCFGLGDTPADAIGTLACKSDGTVWIWGNTLFGMRGNGQTGQNNPKPVQVNIPGNPHIVKVLAGQICMALDDAGNVYSWGGNGNTTLLGTNATDFTTPHKLTFPKVIKDIAGAENFNYALSTDGTLYGWGTYGAYMGIGSTGYYASNIFVNTPRDLTSDLNLPHPISSIATNSTSTHVILTDSTLWGWGDNAQGSVGNGQQLDFGTYSPVYAWNWGPAELLQQKPVQLAPLVHNFTNIFGATAACFYMYAETSTGQLYSWGRNKAAVLGNGVVGATSSIYANYPDAWEQPTITAVNPFEATKTVLATAPYCLLNPGTSPCSDFTIPSNVPPVSNAGADQTLNQPATSTIVDGGASHDPDGQVVYYKWTQLSGPSASTIVGPTYQATSITNLVPGTYTFQLTVTDNGWTSSNSTMKIIVSSSSGNVPPTVAVGSAQTIQLPVSTATLTGTASGNGGATISSTAWTQVSGPATASFGAAGSLSTGVSGLTVPGTYVFQLQATDNNSLSANATVNVIVKAANVAPSVGAGSAQAIQLPVSGVTLTGTASGNGGATISSTAWTEVSGPATASFSAAGNLSTGVSGLTVAGTYTFQLKATDNNSLSATATVTVTVNAVNAQPPSAGAGSVQTIQLPVSTATITGTASGNAGATISSTAWVQTSGPVTAVIGAAGNLSTGLSGLTVAGTYTFELTATDNNGLTATASVNVIVKAANVAPSAGAGSAQTIQLPVSSATLTGTASGNGGATISTTAWTQLSGPATVSFGAAGNLSTGVSGLTVVGTYTFELTATDNNGLTATASVNVIVKAANVAPSVAAGSTQTIQLPVSSVTLTGTASGNGGATISSVSWTGVSGPLAALITAAGSLSPVVSGMTVAGTYVFQLKATDNNGLSSTSTVTVTVSKAANQPPVANAGQAQTVQLPVTSVALNGSGSYDPDGTIVSYSWTNISGGGGVSIVGVGTAQATVYGLSAGTTVFQLTVTDNDGATGTSTVTITTKAPVSLVPVANAGVDTSIALPFNTATLDGSASTDPSGGVLQYKWVQLSGPATAGMYFSDRAMTPVGSLQAGLYVFQLTVTNAAGLSSIATVQVRVIDNNRSNTSGSASHGSAQTSVYPNPVQGLLNVRFTDDSTSGPVLMQIYDLKGNLVRTKQVTLSQGYLETTFDMTGLAAGVYALRISVGNALSQRLIIKQ